MIIKWTKSFLMQKNIGLCILLAGLIILMSSAQFCLKAHAGAFDNELDPFLEKAFAVEASPGMAVAVVHGGELIYARGFGYADIEQRHMVTPETMFYIASTTKSFTAFAAALLDNRDELNLDNPLSCYLPNLHLQPPLSADSITLRQLLTHTHGIENGGPVVFRTAYSGVFTPNLLIELLESYKPSPTGHAFNYGNIGYNIAAIAMDAASGIGWKDLLQREVFKPMDMSSTSARMSRVDRNKLAMPYAAQEIGFRRLYYAKDDNNMHAAGGHVSTVLDLAKWLEMHISSGRFEGEQLFPEKVVEETHRKQADQDRNFAEFHRYGWSLGWDLGTYEGDTLIHRFGSFAGFRSHVSFMSRYKIGVVVLVNEATLGSRLADLVACYIYDRLIAKPGLNEKYKRTLEQFRTQVAMARKRIGENSAKRAARQQPLPHPLAAYTGTYENSQMGRIEWRRVYGKLQVRIGAARSVAEVYDSEENQLRVELTDRGEVVKFMFRGDKAESLTYDGYTFERTDHGGQGR